MVKVWTKKQECMWHNKLNLIGMAGCWGIMREKGMEGRVDIWNY